jgi:hypothetical protein
VIVPDKVPLPILVWDEVVINAAVVIPVDGV